MGGVAFIAQWTPIKYTATVDLDGGAVSDTPAGWTPDDGKYTKDFDFGTSYSDILADFGIPTRTGHTFDGFDPDTGTMGVGGTVFVAEWTILEYTITWKAGDTTLATDTVEYGSMPVYAGAAPAMAATAEFTYEFNGMWSPAVVAATGNQTYQAQFDITEIRGAEVEMSADDVGKRIINSVFEGLAGETLKIYVMSDDGITVLYSWTFEGEYKDESPGIFRTSIAEAEPDQDLTGAISSVKVKNPLILNFAASGNLPVDATVRYFVGADSAGTSLTLFFYDEVTKKLEEKAEDLTVDDEGYVEFSLTHLSVYVLAEPAPGEPADSTMTYIVVGMVILALIAAAILMREK